MDALQLHNLYKEIICGNMKKCVESAVKANDYIKNCTLRFRNNVSIKTLAIPSIYTNEDVIFFKNELHTLYGIFEKVLQAYRNSTDIRRLFGYSKQLEELILLEQPYKSTVPIARIDLFYNKETKQYKFCEFNTDGSSAMNEDRELNTALKMTEAYKIFSKNKKIATAELFNSWVECFCRLYSDYSNGSKPSAIAITDFLDKGTKSEFEVFANAFEKAGIYAEICDIRDFRYDGKRLISPNNKVIDAVYRRAVTADIMNEYNKLQPFISAVKNNDVCLLGDFRTQLPHNKILFNVLHLDEIQHIFNDDERKFIKEHIPYTRLLTKQAITECDACKNKDGWIIKPQDSYASKGFFAGENCSREQWEALLEKNCGTGYILQEFCMPYKSQNIDLTADNPHFANYSTLLGLFVYDGNLQGLYTRASKGDIITTQYDELTLPTIVVG